MGCKPYTFNEQVLINTKNIKLLEEKVKLLEESTLRIGIELVKINTIINKKLSSVRGGANIVIDNTDPINPIINSNNIVIDKTSRITDDSITPNEPLNTTLNNLNKKLSSVKGGKNITIDNTDPLNPIINSDNTNIKTSEITDDSITPNQNLNTSLNNKQNKLIAGENITIKDNGDGTSTISAISAGVDETTLFSGSSNTANLSEPITNFRFITVLSAQNNFTTFDTNQYGVGNVIYYQNSTDESKANWAINIQSATTLANGTGRNFTQVVGLMRKSDAQLELEKNMNEVNNAYIKK